MDITRRDAIAAGSAVFFLPAFARGTDEPPRPPDVFEAQAGADFLVEVFQAWRSTPGRPALFGSDELQHLAPPGSPGHVPCRVDSARSLYVPLAPGCSVVEMRPGVAPLLEEFATFLMQHGVLGVSELGLSAAGGSRLDGGAYRWHVYADVLRPVDAPWTDNRDWYHPTERCYLGGCWSFIPGHPPLPEQRWKTGNV